MAGEVLYPDALPYTKRDLAKVGIDSKAKLAEPFPAGRLVCKLTVALRAGDDGIERNEIRNLEVVRVEDPPTDPFAPAGGDTGCPRGDTDFPFGANAEAAP